MQKTYLYNSDLIIYLKQMKTKYLIAFIIFCIVTNTFSQTSLNDYKYVIVPNKFNFLTEADQYQLNSLTKFLFNKYGFNAVMENQTFPEDVAKNRCLALRSDVEKVKGFLKTKLVIVLKNCKNEIIFTSEVGETREKEYKRAYNLALRAAFESFESVNYIYNDSKTINDYTSTKVEVPIKKESLNNKVEKELIAISTQVGGVEEKAAKQSTVLYAQVIENGFQLVDSTPKVVMILLTTPKQDTFIVKGKDAIVYKEDGFWYISQNDGKNYSTKLLNIKF